MGSTSFEGRNNISVRTGSEVFQYSGYFEWPGLYNYIVSWMRSNLLKIYEPTFKDKTSQDGVTEREITIYGEVKVDRMIKRTIKIDLHLWDCQKVTVTKDGVSKDMERGRIQIKIATNIARDYQDIFNESGISKKLWVLYDKMTSNKFELTDWDDWFAKSHEFFIGIKNYLGVDTE